MNIQNKPKLVKIVDGWAAHGQGWAVHAKTKEEAIKKYHEWRVFWSNLSKGPQWYDNPNNPKRITSQ